MSASVPTSPSLLKSAELGQGGAGQLPARHAKKASMSASVPVSPSQLKSAEPQAGPPRETTISWASSPEPPALETPEDCTMVPPPEDRGWYTRRLSPSVSST